jgi:hypothetical protein
MKDCRLKQRMKKERNEIIRREARLWKNAQLLSGRDKKMFDLFATLRRKK